MSGVHIRRYWAKKKKKKKKHQRVGEASLTVHAKRHAAFRYIFIVMNFIAIIRNEVAVP